MLAIRNPELRRPFLDSYQMSSLVLALLSGTKLSIAGLPKDSFFRSVLFYPPPPRFRSDQDREHPKRTST